MKQPNVVFLFADQWRAQAVGYAGDPNVKTPCLDALSRESVVFTGAVSNCPICTPYRASLLSGRYPLSTGLFMNDLCLPDSGDSLAQVFKRNGYDTAYIGKWHLDGHGRSAYIPPERRQGFDYWKVLECTHDYNNSFYYSGGSAEKRRWPEYDAFSQTADAEEWLAGRKEKDKPFILLVSYGTPHNPYQTAPEDLKGMYDPQTLILRENVPAELAEKARVDLVGYYAHITALDQCVQRIDNALKKAGLGEDTIFIVTSDHGDSMESQCDPAYPGVNKQRPYDESVMVPLLIRGPGLAPRKEDVLIASPDLMPTMLGLCGLPIPDCVEGMDYSSHLKGGERVERDAVLIASYSPFADWRPERGGREFRGIRTMRYTYVEDIDGPWLLFDNQADPYQLKNIIDDPTAAPLRTTLGKRLREELRTLKDGFLPAAELRKSWNYPVDPVGAIPYTN